MNILKNKWVLLGVAILVVILWFFATNKAGANVIQTHRVWSSYSYSDWSECQPKHEAKEDLCGQTVEGKQSRTKTKTCVSSYGAGSNQCSYVGQKDSSKEYRSCDYTYSACEEPIPTPCTENCGNPPTFQGSTTEAPVCSDGNTTSVVANPHVIRDGTQATVNFFITEGDSANIYYKVSGNADWQFSVLDVKPNSDKFVSYTINDLQKGVDYDFGIQQKVGCAGGQIVTSVVHDSFQKATFGLSYYQW